MDAAACAMALTMRLASNRTSARLRFWTLTMRFWTGIRLDDKAMGRGNKADLFAQPASTPLCRASLARVTFERNAGSTIFWLPPGNFAWKILRASGIHLL